VITKLFKIEGANPTTIRLNWNIIVEYPDYGVGQKGIDQTYYSAMVGFLLPHAELKRPSFLLPESTA
jgi:hypothetical protein